MNLNCSLLFITVTVFVTVYATPRLRQGCLNRIKEKFSNCQTAKSCFDQALFNMAKADVLVNLSAREAQSSVKRYSDQYFDYLYEAGRPGGDVLNPSQHCASRFSSQNEINDCAYSLTNVGFSAENGTTNFRLLYFNMKNHRSSLIVYSSNHRSKTTIPDGRLYNARIYINYLYSIIDTDGIYNASDPETYCVQ